MTGRELAAVYAGARVLVTGGLGFIGSNLVRALVELGSDVVVVDALLPDTGANPANLAGVEDAVRVCRADVADRDALAGLLADREVVFNLAGRASHVDALRDPLGDLDANARAQLSLLETCRAQGCEARIVFASTRQVYGRARWLPVDERHPVAPLDPNGVTKYAAEAFHSVYARAFGLRACVLRLTNTYGPGMRVRDGRQTFVGLWLRLAVEGREVLVFGDGTQRRDMTYVDDAVRAFLLCGARDEAVGQVFNVGGDGPVALRDLAELLIDVSGGGSYRLVPFPSERRAIDIGDYVADFGLMRERVGWEPTVGLREGLERSVAFYRDHAAAYWEVAA